MWFFGLQRCLQEPKYLVRLIAITICLGVAIYQLTECVRKILKTPISTHSVFKISQTMMYPSVTLCNNPPYKFHLFRQYGLKESPPFYTNTWENFKFEKYSLDEFVRDATYQLEDIMTMYGLGGWISNVEVREIFKINHGRCFVFTPKNFSDDWRNGYTFIKKPVVTSITPSGYKYEDIQRTFQNEGTLDEVQFPYSTQKGCNLYIHQKYDSISEYGEQTNTYIEKLTFEEGEDQHYILRSHEYKQLPTAENTCLDDVEYSRTKCKENCLHKMITEEIGCDTPWMENSNYRRCSSYAQMRATISSYQNYSKMGYEHLCNCPHECNVTIYMPLIQKQTEIKRSDNIIKISYISSVITVMEEIAGYDWNLFLADLGGSLGFFLGLSVLGFVGLFEEFILIFIKLCKRQTKVADIPNQKVELYLNGVKMDDSELDKKVEDTSNQKVELYLNGVKMDERELEKKVNIY